MDATKVEDGVGFSPRSTGHCGYGFLLSERLATGTPVSAKKTSQHARHLAFPTITLRGEVRHAQRHTADSIATIRYELRGRLVVASFEAARR